MKSKEVLTQIGQRTVPEIREWVGENPARVWALPIADRLAVSGFQTLADLTDDELSEVVAA